MTSTERDCPICVRSDGNLYPIPCSNCAVAQVWHAECRDAFIAQNIGKTMPQQGVHNIQGRGVLKCPTCSSFTIAWQGESAPRYWQVWSQEALKQTSLTLLDAIGYTFVLCLSFLGTFAALIAQVMHPSTPTLVALAITFLCETAMNGVVVSFGGTHGQQRRILFSLKLFFIVLVTALIGSKTALAAVSISGPVVFLLVFALLSAYSSQQPESSLSVDLSACQPMDRVVNNWGIIAQERHYQV